MRMRWDRGRGFVLDNRMSLDEILFNFKQKLNNDNTNQYANMPKSEMKKQKRI